MFALSLLEKGPRLMEGVQIPYLCRGGISSLGCRAMPYSCGHAQQGGGWNEERCG